VVVPHVKFTGAFDMEAAWTAPPAFKFSVPEEDLHVKFIESYLNASREVLLLRYILVEGRLTQTVHVLLAKAEPEWVLKLDRSSSVLRTPGVKLLIATIAAWCQSRRLAKTSSTVEAYETRGRFYAAHAGTGQPSE
jgi:hypothetical protein